jgi:hypothetical protein
MIILFFLYFRAENHEAIAEFPGGMKKFAAMDVGKGYFKCVTYML